jgi:hypothetical protein
VLRIDPTLSRAEVGIEYQRIRQQVLGRRYRPLSNKHLELARFAASQPQVRGAARREAWNAYCHAEHPKETQWLYGLDKANNFSRDIALARKRLLNPPIQFPPANVS